MRLCGGSESDAQDLIQETWIRACSSLPRFQWQSELRTWLTGVLINCSREARRRREPDPEADELSGEITSRDYSGEKLNLEEAISRLSPRTAEPMIAGYFLLTARDYEQAVRVAHDCPLLKYGGTVEVRQIQRRRQ